MGWQRDLEKQVKASMQSAVDKAQRTGKGKSVTSLVRLLEKEFAAVGVTGIDRKQLTEWAEQIREGVRIRVK
ncbi:hypothetical protein Gbro_1166 [Gordonia bronchialis DSM 43247]|uniref:Uncharacterized protein n=1 Tax=Gordonia bronchialis (strain ATCC 25592 / DSM 43247 / BCRC 13721 / JCM 3198 / KCTC 3076 / NBRC 16047 / NCTC 10667) TaxID=526226 RepID=D0L522_GORB4|nr:hypothetical protein [Gordonia bronchialis]ACY20474.1 hypothetical protein Gbro_1166 [Gordonia bronchialis DSM 43247]MCC3323248.1 hypothetical protein [Gordonia bronchialis]QGS25740.1 hypothetical protein FOB84_18005 [Gordonia bronchialis]STQ63278.1 Uncharacterised protein [Gordonia bronchialis]STS10874.1 Uncharacterised protein [Gordonia bronchialis]